MYASVSAIFRGDKSLNKKRENPYINNDQTSKLFFEADDDHIRRGRSRSRRISEQRWFESVIFLV